MQSELRVERTDKSFVWKASLTDVKPGSLVQSRSLAAEKDRRVFGKLQNKKDGELARIIDLP